MPKPYNKPTFNSLFVNQFKVFKFGGASVKDAAAVRNVVNILRNHAAPKTVVVVSAMGKTTNALEEIIGSFLNGESSEALIQKLEQFHHNIVAELFPAKDHPVYNDVAILFNQLRVATQGQPSGVYNEVYDQLIVFGELIATKIVNNYINFSGISSKWVDARKCVRTDASFRAAKIEWQETSDLVWKAFDGDGLFVVQGFIGATEDHRPTTLGREGSDYTAAVLAHLLGAEEVVIWKDVPGVLNGDPKFFQGAVLLDTISYREAIELAFFGASVIHPRTIQPLQKSNIPLRVKSFVDPSLPGTTIGPGKALQPQVTCYIRKTDQLLISLATRDLSFVAEGDMSRLYELLHKHACRVHLVQHSAVSTSLVVNDDPINRQSLIDDLQRWFDVKFNEGLVLYTLRHYTPTSINNLIEGTELLLEQRTRETFQVLLKNDQRTSLTLEA